MIEDVPKQINASPTAERVEFWETRVAALTAALPESEASTPSRTYPLRQARVQAEAARRDLEREAAEAAALKVVE